MEEKRELIKEEVKKEAIVGNDEDKERMLVQVKEELDKEKARKHSIREAGYAAVAQGTGHNYISPFALAIGATGPQVGILASLPGIVAPIGQLIGSRFDEKYKRKDVVSFFILLESVVWLLLLGLALLYYNGIFKSSLPLILIILYGLLFFLGNLATPSWFSWMGDIVPDKIRGKYFAKRNRIYGSVSLFSMLIASFFLDFFKTKGLALIAFAILFLIAHIARLISSRLIRKQYEPKLKLEKGYYISLFKFIKNLPSTNLGKFILFISLFNLTVFIASPFFTVYMLGDLGFSYVTYMVINLTPVLANITFIPVWGRISDKYGNKILLQAGTFLIPLVPLTWLISRNPIYLILVPGILGGLGWAAVGLGANNFMYDSMHPDKRSLFIAYYSIIVGVGTFIGGLIGSILLKYLSITFMHNILFIFLISGILRFVIVGLFIPKIKEPRKVTKPKRIAIAVLKEIKIPHMGGIWHNLGILRLPNGKKSS